MWIVLVSINWPSFDWPSIIAVGTLAVGLYFGRKSLNHSQLQTSLSQAPFLVLDEAGREKDEQTDVSSDPSPYGNGYTIYCRNLGNGLAWDVEVLIRWPFGNPVSTPEMVRGRRTRRDPIRPHERGYVRFYGETPPTAIVGAAQWAQAVGRFRYRDSVGEVWITDFSMSGGRMSQLRHELGPHYREKDGPPKELAADKCLSDDKIEVIRAHGNE